MFPVTLVSQIPTPTGVALPAMPVVVPVQHVPNAAPVQHSQDNAQHQDTGQQSSSQNRGAEFAAILSKAYKQPDTIKYSVDKETGIVSFSVVDTATNEVIRQIPSEEVIAMARALKQSGMLLDKRG